MIEFKAGFSYFDMRRESRIRSETTKSKQRPRWMSQDALQLAGSAVGDLLDTDVTDVDLRSDLADDRDERPGRTPAICCVCA